MTTQTPAAVEIEKWLRIRVRCSQTFASGSERETQSPAEVDSGNRIRSHLCHNPGWWWHWWRHRLKMVVGKGQTLILVMTSLPRPQMKKSNLKAYTYLAARTEARTVIVAFFAKRLRHSQVTQLFETSLPAKLLPSGKAANLALRPCVETRPFAPKWSCVLKVEILWSFKVCPCLWLSLTVHIRDLTEVAGVTFSDSDSAPVPKFLNPCPDLGPAIF